MSRLLLDTCAAIWLLEGQLGSDARVALHEAAARGEDAYVSPITAWEIGLLSARGRLRLAMSPMTWFERLLAAPAVALANLPPKVFVDSSYLPGTPPRDPVDRILIATARYNDYRLITRDRDVLTYSDEGHVKALAC
jgi:PIN domain nuclease of toxin-antitoxin system